MEALRESMAGGSSANRLYTKEVGFRYAGEPDKACQSGETMIFLFIGRGNHLALLSVNILAK